MQEKQFLGDSIVDLTYLQWSISRYSSGTLGSFLKSYEEDELGKIYYKMSNFASGQGVFGQRKGFMRLGEKKPCVLSENG